MVKRKTHFGFHHVRIPKFEFIISVETCLLALA
jgi:hypothetical protein